ncbi:hypothetical protein SGRIM128S_00423 [Streptomyces griseomycini]
MGEAASRRLFREAAAWSVFYVAAAVVFGLWFMGAYGGTYGTEYFAGYLVEKSLSVDNLFVFVIVVDVHRAEEEPSRRCSPSVSCSRSSCVPSSSRSEPR